MKVLPLHCKQLDLCVARMTMYNGGPISSWRRKNSVPSLYFRAKYSDTQIINLVHFFLHKILQKINLVHFFFYIKFALRLNQYSAKLNSEFPLFHRRQGKFWFNLRGKFAPKSVGLSPRRQ